MGKIAVKVSNLIGFKLIFKGKWYSKQEYVKIPEKPLAFIEDGGLNEIGIEVLDNYLILPKGWIMIYLRDEDDKENKKFNGEYYIIDKNKNLRATIDEVNEEVILKCRYTAASVYMPILNLANTYIVDNKKSTWTRTSQFNPLIITKEEDGYDNMDDDDFDLMIEEDSDEEELLITMDPEALHFAHFVIEDIALRELSKRYQRYDLPKSYWSSK